MTLENNNKVNHLINFFKLEWNDNRCYRCRNVTDFIFKENSIITNYIFYEVRDKIIK